MANNYSIDFKHLDSKGTVVNRDTLGFAHTLDLPVTADTLGVTLEEIANEEGPGGAFRLTLTDGHPAVPNNGLSGAWNYQIFFSHRLANGVIDKSTVAAGAHVTTYHPVAPTLRMDLFTMEGTTNANPQLFFLFTDH